MAMGKEIVNAALKHVGEQYILGTVVPKNDPAWAGPWDCAEFVSWCVYQTAKILYGCDDDQADPAIADALPVSGAGMPGPSASRSAWRRQQGSPGLRF
jgi:hypothetical protein